jgi:hypothetical protein
LQQNQKEEGDDSFAIAFFATLQENEKKEKKAGNLFCLWVLLQALRSSKQMRSSTPSRCSYLLFVCGAPAHFPHLLAVLLLPSRTCL